MLELAATSIPSSLKNRVNYLNKSIEELNYLNTFDVALCLGVLAHVSSIEKTFSLIVQALKPKGLAVTQFTDSATPLGRFSHAFHNLSVRVDRAHQYSVNRLSNFDFDQLASNFDLHEIARRRYWPMLPGMSRLPMALNLTFLRATSRNRLLSYLGSETIVLYAKV
jgi:SAM-dependent methyltransferase